MQMQEMPSLGLLSELHRTASWQPDASRTPIEHLVEFILTGTLAASAPQGTAALAEEALRFDLGDIRAVVLGGGTGLSTIVGGNSRLPDWPDQPDVGVKRELVNPDFVVCTTDDGGSTGELLKSLPVIGLGDIRKLLLSSVSPEVLARRYGVKDRDLSPLIRLLHALFNYRFPAEVAGTEELANPLLVAPPELRTACPKKLFDELCTLGLYISPAGGGPTIAPGSHCMGNLLLTAAIFMEAHGRADGSPGLRQVQAGIDRVARLIGAPAGRIHAATVTQGQLKFRYANGVLVYGQSKSAVTHRDSPVERVYAEFSRKPAVSAAVLSAIEGADLIVYAPGSLYTSIIPILQLEPITAAIRANAKALKVLGANSWIQEGETDISLKHQGRGFLVSELIEAYDRNVPGGVDGLFDVVLSANLEHIPGNILRNYALEGKSPIHMDRSPVEAMGFRPVEATLFSSEQEKKAQVIQHDARRFMLAIRTLLYADKRLKERKGYSLRRSATPTGVRAAESAPDPRAAAAVRRPLLCDYLNEIRAALSGKDFHPPALKDFLVDLVWDNRDIRPDHLRFFRGGIVVSPKDWNRNTEWDNVLGYYDPEDDYIKLHRELLGTPTRFREDILVALGESLLGQYTDIRRWIEHHGARAYEIILRPVSSRKCFLDERQLHTYLTLARMTQDQANDRIYRITINNNEGFLPPGLLFGLMYAWYLNGGGLTMEYEMSLLRWPLRSLIPHHAKDRIRKEALVSFFRKEVFGHSE